MIDFLPLAVMSAIICAFGKGSKVSKIIDFIIIFVGSVKVFELILVIMFASMFGL